ncbi:MAG: universal stress protein [Kofleriaceae bacterium]
MTAGKILCPIDFSEFSAHAMTVAVRLAQARGCELVLMHVWYLPPVATTGEVVYPAEMIRGLVDDVERGLAAAVETARKLGATRLSSKLIDGKPWVKIVELAEADPEIDLIVLGTHGRTGLARVFLGSVAEMVVRHAPCSVLTVPQGCGASFRRILCPVDFSESSRLALDLALGFEPGLAPTADRSVMLLHIIEPPRMYAVEAATNLHPGLAGESQELLDDWGKAATATHPAKVSTLVRIGRPGPQILAILEEDKAFDLVAVGSHGRTGLARTLLGSVAERVVRHAARAVLVARPRR